MARADGNANYAKKHWKSLSTWAAYLEKEGFDPADQLCTEDFFGQTGAQCQFITQGNCGIRLLRLIGRAIGRDCNRNQLLEHCREDGAGMMKLEDDGDHYSLAFEQKNTCSQKYNLVWDKLFKLNLFPKAVFEKEIRYYLTKQNEFGLPLDNRKTYTINYSVLWTAVLAANKPEFEKFVLPIYKYATETSSRVPLSGWSETTSSKSAGFQARSVVGGYFMKLLETKLN